MEDLREEWREEDDQLYMKIDERDDLRQQVEEIDKKTNNVYKLLQDHEAESVIHHAAIQAKFKEIDESLKDH